MKKYNLNFFLGPAPPQPLMSENSMDFIGTYEPSVKPEVNSVNTAGTSVSAKANLDNKDYSPFKSYTSGWGNANNDKENDKNFASVASAGSGIDLGSTGDLAAKAPGYRISPSGGPLLATQTGKNFQKLILLYLFHLLVQKYFYIRGHSQTTFITFLFFDHLSPSVYIFYGIKVYKKSIFLTNYLLLL